MTYAAQSSVSASGPAGTQEAAQTHAGRPSASGIRAGVVLIDQFGPVYLDRMQGGAAAPRVPCLDAFSLKLADPVRSDAARVGAFSGPEWWE